MECPTLSTTVAFVLAMVQAVFIMGLLPNEFFCLTFSVLLELFSSNLRFPIQLLYKTIPNKCVPQQISVERQGATKRQRKQQQKHKVLLAFQTTTFSKPKAMSRKLGTMQPDKQRSSFWVYGAKRVDLLLEDERPRAGFHYPLLDGPHYVQGSIGSSSLGGTSSS